jgi:hypothetical protein
MLASTAREEGFAALYRGVTPTLLGILPYAGTATACGWMGEGWWHKPMYGAIMFVLWLT